MKPVAIAALAYGALGIGLLIAGWFSYSPSPLDCDARAVLMTGVGLGLVAGAFGAGSWALLDPSRKRRDR